MQRLNPSPFATLCAACAVVRERLAARLARLRSVRVRRIGKLTRDWRTWRYTPLIAESRYSICLCPDCCDSGRRDKPGIRAAVIASRMAHDRKPRAGFGFQCGKLALQVTYDA